MLAFIQNCNSLVGKLWWRG